jgi:HK97 family phage major capsid protein/HK97 family phage prohead protease
MSTENPSLAEALALRRQALDDLDAGRPVSTQRGLLFERAAINEEARTASLAFASEEPYERWWGIEILECTAGAMRQGRLRSGANLLCDHDTRDVVGVVESVEIGADRVARAVVRFGKSARAEEVWQDVKDGIRRNVSVGYLIHKALLVETVEGVETYRVTDWEPFEVSLVSVPADATVGVGRSLETAGAGSLEQPAKATTTPSEPPKTQEVRTMSEVITPAAPAALAAALVQQRNHAAEIAAIAKATTGVGIETLAMKSIVEGHTTEQFQAELIRHMATKPLPSNEIGMTKDDTQRFSLVRLLNAMGNPDDQRAQKAAGFEYEVCRAAADKVTHREVKGLIVPHDVLKRNLSVGTPTAGGNTVATNLLSGNMIELLRNKMVLPGMGMQVLTDLVGNIAIPRVTGGATAYWVAESGSPTASGQTFDQVAMTPRTLGAQTAISRKLLLQSSLDVEAFVQNDLARVLALELQRVAINGSGTAPEPRGILPTVGIGSVAGGTNGLAPNWSHIVGLETEVAQDNADEGTLGYLTNTRVRGRLKQTSKVSGQNGFIWEGGEVNGYQAQVTNAVPSNLVKGTSGAVCSAIIFGNFAELIMGLWGGLELMVNPYTNAANGGVIVHAFQDADLAVRHAESFSAMVDALTV